MLFIPEATFAQKDQTTVIDQFCQSDSVRVTAIQFEGNKKTKESILLVELDIQLWETYDSATFFRKVEESRLRLYNLQLFHWVKAEVVCGGSMAVVKFQVQERWYLFPVPIFSLADRNFSAWLDKMDFKRIDYGLHLVQYNMRGRNETLKANLQHGFNRKYELFYTFPYISRKNKIGLNLGGSYYQSHFLDYNTINDTLATLKDESGFPIQRYYVTVGLLRRENVQKQFNLNLSYHQQQISDSVNKLNPEYFIGEQQRSFFQSEIIRTLNFRNSFSYPLAGSFLQLSLIHQLFLQTKGNFTATVKAKYASYHSLPHKLYYSYSLEGQARLAQNLAYADNQALGYKSYIRGYQLYVIDGQHFGMFKQGFSRQLINIPEIYVGFLPSDKFRRIPLAVYANVFTDAAYVSDNQYENQNTLSNRFLYSAGVGLHFVTYYDRVLTVEYAVNHLGDTGFYIQTQFPF